MRELIDESDGENRAVRMFLMLYGGSCGINVGDMRKHMERSGYPFWPTWAAESHPGVHLTKGGAQHWLRHLFSLEEELAGGIAHTCAGFRASFESEHKRKPTDQEVWNAAIRSWLDLHPTSQASTWAANTLKPIPEGGNPVCEGRTPT